MIEVLSEQMAVDAGKVHNLKERVRKLIKEPEYYEYACVIKFTLEELGLWDEKTPVP